ncbi:MAG: hypothetical protein ACI8W7_003463 [Gammaproteobacteria bacterium]|jgi:hypothetical protein
MLSLTLKHFVVCLADGSQHSVVHPPSWVVSIEPCLDGSARLAYLDTDVAISTSCADLSDLIALLGELENFHPGADTAQHRCYYQYDAWFALHSDGESRHQRVSLSLNDCADVGREPEPLRAILGWLAVRLLDAAPNSKVASRLALWAAPAEWDCA